MAILWQEVVDDEHSIDAIRYFDFLIILGYVLKRVGLFRQEDSKVLSNIMLYVTLPAVLVNAFRSFTLDVHLFSFVLLGLLANVILLVVAGKWEPGKHPGACHVHDLSGRI